MIESAKAMIGLVDIARAHWRVDALMVRALPSPRVNVWLTMNPSLQQKIVSIHSEV